MENRQDEDIFFYPEIDEVEDTPTISTELKSKEEPSYSGTKRQQKRQAREDAWNQTKDKRKQEDKVQSCLCFYSIH